MLKNKFLLVLTTVVILLPILPGLVLWKNLPEQMPIHWNSAGQADHWAGKPFAVLFMPLILLALHWGCVWLTEKEQRRKYQDEKILAMMLWISPMISLMSGIAIYSEALGVGFNTMRLAMVVLGILFSVIGNYLPKCRWNHTIGIRVPWTLSSEATWYATHRFGGKLWMIGGVLMALCGLLPENLLVIGVLVPVLLLAVIPIAYAYIYHKKMRKEEEHK